MVAPTPPRSLGPAVRAALDDRGIDASSLAVAAEDGAISVLRSSSATDPVALLYQPAPDPAALLDEADRLLWLAGRTPAPEVLASSRSDDGDEALLVRLGADASSADHGHPMGPEALMQALADSLLALHGLPTDHCPFTADSDVLRKIVDERIDEGLVGDSIEGPYAGRSVGELASIFDDVIEQIGAPDDPVFVHGALTAPRVWLDPSGAVTFLGWHWAGLGDRHVDLAAGALLLNRMYGPALVGPFFEAYGMEQIDIRRLDAHQILSHLLT